MLSHLLMQLKRVMRDLSILSPFLLQSAGIISPLFTFLCLILKFIDPTFTFSIILCWDSNEFWLKYRSTFLVTLISISYTAEKLQCSFGFEISVLRVILKRNFWKTDRKRIMTTEPSQGQVTPPEKRMASGYDGHIVKRQRTDNADRVMFSFAKWFLFSLSLYCTMYQLKNVGELQ